MPPPALSPVTGNPVPPYYIHSNTLHFQDTHGRSLLLRGVNLSGSVKHPNGQPSHQLEGFWETAEAGEGDFINRPLNLDDGSAEVHLARLRAWGYNMLRYVFTWESLEHEGPKKYDYAYMDYIIAVLRRCQEWGFRVFMDPHQDVWSRFNGGSGAPLWTVYACGIDPRNQTVTAAAYLHSEWPSPEAPKPGEFPAMIWGTNYTHMANQTIWTLFFAGKTFAPKCIIDGKNIQDYLQDHYIDAVGELAKRIADNAPELYDRCIIGWDTMNEPGDGLIAYENLAVIPSDQQLKKGPTPTPIEGMQLGMGQALDVQTWNFGPIGPYRGKKERIDPKGKKLWLSKEDEKTRGGGKWGWTRGEEWEMGTCIWAQHGVWDPATNTLLRPDYFKTLPSDPSHHVDFVADFWSLHWLAYSSRVRIHHPEAIHFIQAPVMKQPPKLPASFLGGRACSSPHFYDGLTLMTKHWNWFNADAIGVIRKKYWSIVQAVRVGEANIRKMMQGELSVLREDTVEVLGKYPTLIGEIGIPYDMDDKQAYGYVNGGRGEGDFSSQQKAMDCSMNACDGPNNFNYTIWNYVPDNVHEWGDNWNGEDLSLWSPDNVEKRGYQDSPRPGTPLPTQGSSDFTASSATLAVSSSDNNKSLASRVNLQTGDIPPSLILSGARASAAFCRPFPVASVGTPEKIDFDIASTRFTYSVRVRADDLANDQIYTELYIPFIHYAANLDSVGKGVNNVQTSSLDSSNASTLTSRNTSKANLIEDERAVKNLDPSSISVRSASPATAPLALQINIKVSHGRTEIEGQTLKWFYPVPESGEAVYTIEVERKEGALRKDEGYVQEGSWFDVCPGECVVA
ncbi:hypothetical protein I350_02859 [Cryptococcus amylolentus CBS 6273]|uniref:Glycoside hydrolase family 5 domain-containing protein n=1 Tax=Cryptococcus amylolentus CBS 6273 TaxID=1296118 RepID=A0A1E3K851_9TREE|nr:hypothetical protein I350_02859 [Cryptococcus amylolentus CBS 6273]